MFLYIYKRSTPCGRHAVRSSVDLKPLRLFEKGATADKSSKKMRPLLHGERLPRVEESRYLGRAKRTKRDDLFT